MRRIRYFTFCAVGAVDVLMLDIAKIATRSSSGRLDNVVFLTKTAKMSRKPRKQSRAPLVFPETLKIVLQEDAEEDNIVDGLGPLNTIAEEEDTAQTRQNQTNMATRRKYITHFPFDILNIDLERYFLSLATQSQGKWLKL